MATNKKKSSTNTKSRSRGKGQMSFKFEVKDERIPKIMGIFCWFIAFYLFIAFTSYLFTWQEDQDRVLRFSWSLFTQSDLEMANWLGRLGAIVSNMFFYWGFGIPSFIFIFLLFSGGKALIKRVPLKKFYSTFKYSVVVLLLLSVLFEFVMPDSAFPWGGAFGEGINSWLYGFVGTAGMILLFIFAIFGMVTWMFNPNYNELTYEKAVYETKLYAKEMMNGGYKKRPPVNPDVALSPPVGLRPNNAKKEKQRPFEKKKEGAPSFETKKQLELEAPKPASLKPAEPLQPGGQLAFGLENKKREKPPSLTTDSTLEIQAPSASPPTPRPELPKDPEINPNAVPKPTLSVEQENKKHLEPYDPTLDLSSYENPVLALLKDYDDQKIEIDRAELEQNKDQIIETLLNYKIEIIKIRATVGPTVTLYEIVPAPGVRISKIKNLEDDIALSLSALGIRIIAPIPGRGTIGIEVPNKKKQIVSLKEVLISEKFKRAKMDLPIALGKTINNEVFVADLAKMPHLLVAGATGQGKSVGINTIIMSLLYKKHPSQVKLVLVDPKKVELFPYSKLENHFLSYLPNQDEPITTETNKVVHTLNSLCIEMDQRYDLLKKAHARNIREYNDKFVNRRLNPEKGHRFLPFIVLVIDEFADLIMTAGKEIELPIGRLAQLARAIGIHLIIATQRPSVNIITGVIKANFPARLAFKVTSKIDSRTILDGGGADQLIGRGDMLLSVGGDTVRLQCAFVDTPEVERVIDFIGSQQGYPIPHFLPEFHGDDEEHAAPGQFKMSELDDLFEDASRLVVSNQHGSTSMIQRRLKLGYNRAGRIMDQMEQLGIVGPSEGSKPREVLMYDERELERFLEDIKQKK
ncbi:MAG: DNA translocase FtsK 4TM domain-containing protein [Bacteroidota bacterium]